MTSWIEILIDLPPLASILLRMTVVLGVGWILHLCLRRSNPRWRVLLWRGVIAGAFLVPMLMPLKYLEVPVPPPSVPVVSSAIAVGPDVATVEPVIEIADIYPTDSVAELRPETLNISRSSFSIIPWARENVWLLLSLGWTVVAVVIAVRFVAAFVGIRRKVRSSVAGPKHLEVLLNRVAGDLNCGRKPALMCSTDFASPFLAGLTKPVIVLPERMTSSKYADELPAVFAHEIAHLRSRDLLWMAAARCFGIVFWFHPLAWKLRDAHSTACEEVCDAVAADYVGNTESYSSTLAQIALEMVGKVPAIGGIPMARSSEIVGRLRMLKRKVYSSGPARRWVVLSLLIGFVALAGLGGLKLVYAETSRAGESDGHIVLTAGLPTETKPETHAIADSSQVAITSYSMDVDAFPQSHLLKVRATVSLTSEQQGVSQLRFKLREQLKVEKITQADTPLQFSQIGRNVTVEGIQVAQDSPPLIWQYQGIFKPPFDSDSMEDVIFYADEIRLTYTSHWYPEPAWVSQLGIKPASRLKVEVPERFAVISGSKQERPPVLRDGRILYQYGSRTHGSLSFIAAQYAKTGIPWGDKTLEAYFFPKKPGEKPKLIAAKLPQEEKKVLETLEIAKNILDFYSDKFAPYPWSSFALVQKSKHAAYAYGVQTYVVMNNLARVHEKTLAHEIAHQWWGSLVKPIGQGERWLTESLAEYSAFLYMEYAHGSKKVVGDSREFLLRQMQNMHPIRNTSFDTPDYGNIVYHIGPHVFHMLRYVVGEEQFSDILRTFTEQYAYRNTTVEDFIEVAERVHKNSLSWFFDQWLDRTKNPSFVLESETIKQPDNTFLVKGAITQHNTDYRMPLDIEIIGKDKKENRRIWAEGSKTPFEYPVSYEASEVRFADEMTFWVLADFFHSEQERLAAAEKRPKPPPQRSRDELFSTIRRGIAVELRYELGTEIELELEAEQAARLDCVENPYDYNEILICPMEGVLYNYTFYTDGRYSGGGMSLEAGNSYRGRSMETRNIAIWEIEDEKVHIKFRVETDREKIKQGFRERLRRRGKTPEEIEEKLEELFPDVINANGSEGSMAKGPKADDQASKAKTAGVSEFLGLDLGNAPRTRDWAAIPELWEERPPGSRSYEIHSDARFVFTWLGGTVYNVAAKNAFYVQHDPMGSSHRTYYGPFEGDPYEVLNLEMFYEDLLSYSDVLKVRPAIATSGAFSRLFYEVETEGLSDEDKKKLIEDTVTALKKRLETAKQLDDVWIDVKDDKIQLTILNSDQCLERLGVDRKRKERSEAGERLYHLGKALRSYANDNQSRYPDTLQELQERGYIGRTDLKWALERVAYVGQGRSSAGTSDMLLVYDRQLLAEDGRTFVFFSNGRLDSLKADQLKQ